MCTLCELDKVRAHLANRQAAYIPTPAQETMRREMEQPKSVGGILDDLLGVAPADPAVRELAIEIIKESPTLTLSLTQWAQVQEMLEAAIQLGVARGRAEGGHHIPSD